MKRLFILAFALAIATSAFAGKPTAHYSGIVEKYDAATKTLTIKHGDKQGDFVITDTSEVLQGGTKADASALAVGRKVEVEFMLDGPKKLVQKVKVSGATAAK